MKLIFKKKTDDKVVARLKKKVRVRNKISGTSDRPRLSVFKSNQHIFAQIIDDTNQKTLVSASTLKLGLKCNREAAKKVGEEIGRLAKEKNIETVVFDRNGFLYHGRVKEVSNGARAAGIKF